MTMHAIRIRYHLLLFSIPALIGVASCNKGAGENQGAGVQGETLLLDQAGILKLTRTQFESSGMKVGDPGSRIFSLEVNANGNVVSTISGSAKISSLVPGRIMKINHNPGELVNRGEVLFSLEGNEIILIQQEYAEAFNQLNLLAADYERLKALSQDAIVARKDFLKTESDFRSMQARVEGLKARLRMLQIDPSMIEQGSITPHISVRAPIRGVITRQDLVLGQAVETQETLLELVDTKNLQLKLQVFEHDLADIMEGQPVRFYVPDHPEREYEATISHLGGSIDPDTRTIACLAQIGTSEGLVNNLYVEARIITHRHEALAIPEQALVRQRDQDYVMVLSEETADQLSFRKVQVHTGITQDGYVEILDQDLSGILTEGAYNLWVEETND